MTGQNMLGPQGQNVCYAFGSTDGKDMKQDIEPRSKRHK